MQTNHTPLNAYIYMLDVLPPAMYLEQRLVLGAVLGSGGEV